MPLEFYLSLQSCSMLNLSCFLSALFRPRVPFRVREVVHTTVYSPCTQCFPLKVGREGPSPEFREHLIEPTGRKRRKQTPSALFFSPLLGFHTGGSNCRLMCISAVQRLTLLSPIPPASILILQMLTNGGTSYDAPTFILPLILKSCCHPCVMLQRCVCLCVRSRVCR